MVVSVETNAAAAPSIVARVPAPRRSWAVPAFALISVVAAAAFGFFVTNTFVITLAGYTCAFALFALSLNLMLGGLGEVPLGQCVFFGLGAYSVGIGMVKFGLPYEVTIVIGMLLSTAAAAAIGGMTLRLTGAYFSIVSWGLSGVMMVAALNLTHLTEGPLGIFGFSAIKFGPMLMTDPQSYFWVCSLVLIAVVLLLHAVRDSQFRCGDRERPAEPASRAVDRRRCVSPAPQGVHAQRAHRFARRCAMRALHADRYA